MEDERRIDELCRENEKLRQYNNTLRDQIDTAKHNSVRNTREYARLCHVNDKLRELVADLMPVVCSGCHERLCEMPKEEHPFVECLFADRARELGVEVDG